MEFDNPWALASSLLIGSLGMGLFIYGKKNESFKPIAAGVVLMVFPYFVHSVLLMWALTVVCVGGLWAAARGSRA
jgi:hypothetical protein